METTELADIKLFVLRSYKQVDGLEGIGGGGGLFKGREDVGETKSSWFTFYIVAKCGSVCSTL